MNSLWSHRFRTLTAERAFYYLGKVVEKIALLLLLPVSYAVMHAYSLIRGKKYRIGEINAQSLGGWSYKLDGFLRRVEKNDAENQVNYIFVMHSKRIANKYFYELMKRHVNVIENPFVRLMLLPLARVHNSFQAKGLTNCTEKIGQSLEAVPWFNDHDIARGEHLLKELGLDSKDAWYVCFFARDNAYNESTSVGAELDYYKTYHACRNADIDNYITAIKFILENGGYVIRMGSVVKKRISYFHPRLIDYPFSGYRSDFADVYLACHCKFFIGNGSGILDLSGISDVPIGMVDLPQYYAGITRKNMLYIPKLMKFSYNGEYVSVKKYFDLFEPSSLTSLDIIEIMKKNDIIFEDNSENDILMITKAFYQRFVTKSVTDEEWAAWQEGADCCRPFFHKGCCYIWGPFIDKHRYLM